MKLLDDTKIPDRPYPELREVLRIFTDEIVSELGENLVGIYLVGSIASGDFDADSDVDFLVVTNRELPEEDMQPPNELRNDIKTALLHTLQTGTVLSKKTGMQWAKQFVDLKWAKLIDRAWHGREGVRLGIKIGQRAESTLLHETLDFINYAVSRMDTIETRTS